MNDRLDIEGDRINHPKRVLVTGMLSPKYARNLALVLNAAALLMAWAISLSMLLIGLVTVGLLSLYNLKLKRIPLVGNAVVALLAAMTFLTGGFAVNPDLVFRLPGPLVAAAFAFFFHLVREIVKDIQDMDGDRRAGLDSLPLRIGSGQSLTLALVLFTLMTLLTCVPVLKGWYGLAYEVIVVYLVDLPLLGFMIALRIRPTSRMLTAGSTALKIGMALGLVALVLA